MSQQQIPTYELLAVCPKTGRQVAANYFTYEPVTSETEPLVAWWRCSACNRWHVSEIAPPTSEQAQVRF